MAVGLTRHPDVADTLVLSSYFSLSNRGARNGVPEHLCASCWRIKERLRPSWPVVTELGSKQGEELRTGVVRARACGKGGVTKSTPPLDRRPRVVVQAEPDLRVWQRGHRVVSCDTSWAFPSPGISRKSPSPRLSGFHPHRAACTNRGDGLLVVASRSLPPGRDHEDLRPLR